MAKTQVPYAAVFRQQMIDLVHAGRTPEDLAKEFEPTAQTIYNCVAGPTMRPASVTMA